MIQGRVELPRERRRLLFVVNVSWFFISHRMELAKRAVEAGYEVHLATRVTSPEDASTIRQAGIVLHDLPIGRGDAGVAHDLRAALKLMRLYGQLRPDIAHLVTIKVIVIGGVMARLVRLRALVGAVSGLGHAFTDRGFWPALRRMLVVRLMKLVTSHPRCTVICQNSGDQKLLLDIGVAKPANTQLIRGAGVDLTLYKPTAEPGGPLRVLLASRMLSTKGVLEFVECARMLKPRWPQAQFILAGAPDPANPASIDPTVLRDWDNQGHVQWIGPVRDMVQLFASCHIVTLPSYAEGVPKVLIEAAAAGRPIVTTDIAGCREIVKHGENGLLVPPRDALSLAQAVEQLLLDKELRSRFGSRGRELAELSFGQELVVAQTFSVYERLLAAQ